MLDKDIQPNTIGGIKRYAKQIKKEYGIPHNEALNKAAQKACFENYSHALNSLSESKATKSQYRLFFSTYWHDKSSRTFGREVLEIKLPKPLLEIATKSDMKKANGLSWFRLASLDHFVHDQVIRSQETARDSICKAVRELRFMEATGLKPTNDYEAAYPNRDPNNKLPQTDHATNWEDPDSGQFILVDEPYLGPVITGERAEWADKHSWHLQASKWQGMYYPGESQMFIATDATTGYDFTSLMEKIDNIPSPITTENWNSESSFGHDIFLSPQAITPQDKKRAIAKGTIHREPSSKTVPMRYWDAADNNRRPNAVMPIESHLLAARLIIAVQRSQVTPYGVNSRLSSIKSKLEDWFFSEYNREVTNKYGLFYYGDIAKNDSFVLKARSLDGVITLLQNLKELLDNAYVDCEPLRRLIRKVDTSIKLTSKYS